MYHSFIHMCSAYINITCEIKMCIPFGGLSSGAPVISTPKGDQLRSKLNIVLMMHSFIALLKMFILNPFSAFGDVISCLILYCGIE